MLHHLTNKHDHIMYMNITIMYYVVAGVLLPISALLIGVLSDFCKAL